MDLVAPIDMFETETRRTHKNPFQNAKDFRVRSTDPCSSVVSFIDIGCGLCGAKKTWRFFASSRLGVKTAWALFQEGCRYVGGTVLVQVADYKEELRGDLQVRDVESIIMAV